MSQIRESDIYNIINLNIYNINIKSFNKYNNLNINKFKKIFTSSRSFQKKYIEVLVVFKKIYINSKSITNYMSLLKSIIIYNMWIDTIINFIFNLFKILDFHYNNLSYAPSTSQRWVGLDCVSRRFSNLQSNSYFMSYKFFNSTQPVFCGLN